jgi:hypothetical protein
MLYGYGTLSEERLKAIENNVLRRISELKKRYTGLTKLEA